MKEILDLLSTLREKGIRLIPEDSGKGFVLRGNLAAMTDLEKNSLKEFKQQILTLLGKANAVNTMPIPVQPSEDSYVLSSAQKRLWVLSQFEKGSAAYNVYTLSIFEGSLSYDTLLLSLDRLIERHEILRTVFKEDSNGEIKQHIKNTGEQLPGIRRLDVRREKATAQYLNELLSADISKPFDLVNGPLIRTLLIQTEENKWIFGCVMHHIICDAWSLDILIRELFQHYEALSIGYEHTLHPLRIQYKDYAAWQQAQLNDRAITVHREYWLKKFEGVLPVLDLPADKPRPAVKTYQAGVVTKKLDASVSTQIKSLCQQHDCTIFMGCLALVNALLYRYSGQEDITIGSPVTGREHSDLENQVGFYVNTLAVRTSFNGSYSYIQLLNQVKTSTLEAYEHQSFPFDELIDELHVKRDMSRGNLFDTMVVLHNSENIGSREIKLNGLRIRRYEAMQYGLTSKFDLVFNFILEGGEIDINLEYNSDIYHESTVERMVSHLAQMLEAVIANPSAPINRLDYLSEEEKKLLLSTFNDTASEFPVEKTVVGLFEHTAKTEPDRTAIVFEGGTISYGALNEKANELSDYLNQKYHIQPGDLVGIKLQRSPQLIIAILAVLKSGGAYVPIDPGYPLERIEYILKDSSCKVLIDENELRAFSEEDQNIYKKENPSPASGSHNLAYVVYTSGSTGNPKGIMIEHKKLLNLCYWQVRRFAVINKDRASLYAGVGFDASVWEIFPYIITGACLYIIPENIRFNADAIAKYYDENDITISFLPTQIGEQFIKNENRSLRYLLLGGDKLSSYQAKPYKIINNYGPSENTVVATSCEVVELSLNIPIGRPISNVRIYILDNALQLCAIGTIGEICIAGESLARGYINSPELTAEKFVKNPWIPGDRLYRTGDLGRWLRDGNIEFAGRKDEQLKIRGCRIEPGEIENTLQNHKAVDKAFVTAVANKHAEKELVAYITSSEQLSVAELRTYLAKTLPVNMIPQHFVSIREFPITQNGKVDKKALPNPLESVMQSGAAYVAPRNTTEEKLVLVWEELLGRQKIGIKDDFFESGGHSLKATRLASSIHKIFGVKLTLEQLFTNTILEEQAKLISVTPAVAFTAIPAAPLQTAYPLSSAQQRLWLLSQLEEGNLAYNMPALYIFEGALDLTALEYAFSALLARHEILRTVFRQDQDGTVKQFIVSAEQTGFNIKYKDLRMQNEEGLKALISESLGRSFDLRSSPLVRAELFQVKDDKFVFLYSMHHIISDGWSMGLLINELLSFYEARVKRKNYLPEPLSLQYKDFATWQQDNLKANLLSDHKIYWLKQFGGQIPLLELWGGKVRPAVRTYNGDTIKSFIPSDLTNGIKTLCREEGVTLFMGLLAVVNVLLYRYTGQSDIIIGTPIAGRELSELEKQIGLYINTLALRTSFEAKEDFKTLLAKVHDITFGAFKNQVYPFDELVKELGIQWSRNRNPLFDVMISFQDEGMGSLTQRKQLHELVISEYEMEMPVSSKVDLSFDFVETSEGLAFNVEYNSDVYMETLVRQFAAHIAQIMEAVIKYPFEPLQTLDFLHASEKDILLSTFNHTAINYHGKQTYVTYFEQQVICNPSNTALVFENTAITYQELNERANQFCNYLRGNYQVEPDSFIGIHLRRNEWLIIVMLGVLKSGAAYMPIDTEYPAGRVNYLLNDSQLQVLINEEELNRFKSVSPAFSKENIAAVAGPVNLAYLIYTSGSTGTPKGVMIEHKSLLDYALTISARFRLQEKDRVIQQSSVSFDTHVEEIYPALLSGACILMTRDGGRNIEELKSLIELKGATILSTTPMVVNELNIANINLYKLRLLISGGDKFNASYVSNYLGKLSIYDSYGPTEATVCCSFYRVEHEHTDGIIGAPLYNKMILILNESDQLQPVGVAGEICISGEGLARGYLNQPALTEKKFRPNPFLNGKRMYKTGDLGRWLPDGNISFIGRIDQQVKVRGYRVEPGEVECAMMTHRDINAAVVCCKANEQGENELVAYFISRIKLNASGIRKYLSDLLPLYMIPVFYVQMETIPLTSNGKTDMSQLPDPLVAGIGSGRDHTEPRNETDEKLVVIWQELLAAKKIGIKDDFFELGGHSLKAGQLISKINMDFGIRIGIEQIFEEPTIERISDTIGFFRHQMKQQERIAKLIEIEL